MLLGKFTQILAKGMTTLQLKIMLENVQIKVSVVSFNCIPQNRSYPSAYIFNTDDSFSPGQHWVAVYFPSLSSPAEYFDSFGRSPLKELKLMNYIFNKVPLQHPLQLR